MLGLRDVAASRLRCWPRSLRESSNVCPTKERRGVLQSGSDLALVTGASSGIGAEFARQLAARGINLILTARRQERLAELAAELTDAAKYPAKVSVTVIAADLNQAAGPEQLLAELESRGLSPSVLINNAGFGFFGKFLDQPADEIEAMIQVNVRAATLLAHRLAHAMARRKRGAILNVASFAALAPIPRYAVYSGAKAYLVAWSQALAHELKKSHVRVSVLCPGFTRSEFHDVARHEKSSLMRRTELTPEYVARIGLRGLERGQAVIVPGMWYRLNALLMRFLPAQTAVAMSARSVR
jgi:short-subunit dehydrogenase